jgi:hypothetical protein
MSNRTRSLIAAWIIIFVGSIAIISTIYDYLNVKKANSWKTTTGTITHAEILEHKWKKTFSNIERTTYRPMIEYRYAVDGIQYENSQVRLDDDGGGIYEKAKEYVSSYETGSTVRVYYNPELPSESALITGALSKYTVRAMWAGLGVQALGFFLLYTFWRRT